MKPSILSLFVVIGAASCTPSLAHGQFYPPAYRPPVYGGYGGGYANPYSTRGLSTGFTLMGSADVTRATGDVIVQQEEARVTREKANQAKIDTKRKAFDEMNYEKANTPSYTEELTKEKAQILTRLMSYPIRSEITDGKTLNAMLPLLQSMSQQGTQGQPVPLPQSMVNQLNISSSGQSSVGMLRDGGVVDWPIALRGPYSKKLDKLLPEAYNAAVANTLTPKLMKQVRTEMSTMREDMRKQLRNEEIENSSYMQAIEFYNALESSVNALERPASRKELSGANSPRARNVQELVDFMTDNGLKFAPATPGNENAYQVAHDAFVRYARVAQSSAGLQAMNAPPPPSPDPYRKK